MAARVLLLGGGSMVQEILDMKDQTDLTILDVIVDRGWEFQEQLYKNLATDIANKVGKQL
jgi:hypothetical protein